MSMKPGTLKSFIPEEGGIPLIKFSFCVDLDNNNTIHSGSSLEDTSHQVVTPAVRDQSWPLIGQLAQAQPSDWSMVARRLRVDRQLVPGSWRPQEYLVTEQTGHPESGQRWAEIITENFRNQESGILQYF